MDRYSILEICASLNTNREISSGNPDFSGVFLQFLTFLQLHRRSMKFHILPHTCYGILRFSRSCTEMLLNGSAYGRGQVRGTPGDARTGEGKFI